MTRRTIEAYQSVLEYIHQNIIPIRGKAIIIDFEKAMRQAIKTVSPNMKILGCWFHFCQALRRKMASMNELFQLVRNDSECKNLFRQFQCLALLPEDDISEVFVRISREALKKSTLFSSFIDYFHDEWISVVTPKHFSVFAQDTRTTSAAENFNCKSNKAFRTHGNFYSFCEVLQKEELSTSTELEHDLSGSVNRVRESKYYKERNKLIKVYSAQLCAKEISALEFLKTMANIKNKIIYSDSSISIEDVEVDESVNTELEGHDSIPQYDVFQSLEYRGESMILEEIDSIPEDDELQQLVYHGESEESFVLNTNSIVNIEENTGKSWSFKIF